MNLLYRTVICCFVLILLTVQSWSQDLIEFVRSGNYTDQFSWIENRLSKEIYANYPSGQTETIQLFEVDYTKSLNHTDDVVSDVMYLSLNKDLIPQFLKNSSNTLSLSIPVDNEHKIILDLLESHVTSDDFKVTLSSGKPFVMNEGLSRFYRGIVRDNPNSIATVNIFQDKIEVLISDQFGNYILGPKSNEIDTYVFFNDKNFNVQPEFACEEMPEMKWSPPAPPGHQKSTGSSDCVRIYIEADNTTYDNFNDDETDVINFVTGFFNSVAAIYQNEGIPIVLSEIKVWDTNDPYSTNCSTILSEFNITDYNGDLAHLITAKNSSSFCGISWLLGNSSTGLFNKTTICSNRSQSYSQTSTSYQSYPSYSWTVNVFSHEMGHAFGSPHTHECLWGPDYDEAIDDCGGTSVGCPDPGTPAQNGGTIMSYCHKSVGISFSNGFGPLPGDHILDQYNSVSCLSGCSGQDPVPGCTDPDAHNYNPNATTDDGSCKTCYDGKKNGDETDVDCGGSKCDDCEEEEIAGCTNPNAHNYNPQATQNDGSCETCNDGIRNGDEEDTDCGGSKCGPCTVTTCNVQHINGQYIQGFEQGLGNWSQSNGDDFNWTVESGSTPSNSTGPSEASQGTYYIYTEASGSNNPYKTAIIESPCLDISAIGSPLLNFVFHMYGDAVGTLKVEIQIAGQGSRTTLFEHYGNLPTNDWYILDPPIDLSDYSNEDFKLIFTGTTGPNWSSDIAIDYIHIYDDNGNSCSDGIQNGNETGIDCGGSECESCPCTHTNLTLSGQIQNGTVERVKNTIKTSLYNPPVIKNASQIDLKAGDFIELNKGFTIEPGGTLTLSIDQCDNTTTANTEYVNFKKLQHSQNQD